ncbi:MAG TPA: M1 family metallopeptidase [Gemmatimonadaceae bacterium]|nr:M1 family metallopeptidase [Gemmatimonadaceae bacterium]
MTRRSLHTLGSLALVVLVGTRANGQQYPERAVRRDIPITNAIRKALTAGSRDSTGRPNAKYWQLRTDYTINARLDPATQRITGHESIRLKNNSPDSLRDIVMRLDMNMFLFNVPRAAPWIPAELTDGFVISKVTANGQPVNLTPPPAGRGGGGRGGGGPAPRTENSMVGLNTTRGTVQLMDAVPPGATATLEIDWSHKVPGGPNGANHRMTQRWGDTLFQPTQWYPRVAVYDDLRGWDPEAYLGPSEFYNNFGRFDVSIDVPAGWVVGGTGVLQNGAQVLTPVARERLAHVLESDSVRTIIGTDETGPGKATAAGDRLTWHFVADTVNDFAWVTAKKLNWTATRANIPGKAPVPINMYFQPGDSGLYRNAGPVARHALEFYSKLYFPYAFPQLTLQDGPSSGMEYPMVINANQGAADHETFHQWAPMTVSNNETWYGWMDEGFNQYANILSGADSRGNAPNLNGQGQSYGAQSGNESEAPMMYNANFGGPRYSFMTYSKMPLLLSSLGGVVGDSAVQKVQSDWAKAWMFKHPSPWDWMFYLNNALKARAGGDLGWFFYYWLFTTESVDGSIRNVTTTGTKTSVEVRQDGQMPSPVVLNVHFAPGGPAIKPMPNAKMLNDSTAQVTYPVSVWFMGAKSFTATLDFGGRTIERIVLDPGCRFPDRDPSDNVWPRMTAPTDAAAAAGGRGGRGGRGGGGGGGGRGGAGGCVS